jgi:transposase
MKEEELIKQIRAENEQLKREIELLKDYIKELEARLAKYENAHTPPSLRRGRNGKTEQKGGGLGKPGRKLGHEGVTRSQANPDRQVEVIAYRCPDCGTELSDPIRFKSKIIEELPELSRSLSQNTELHTTLVPAAIEKLQPMNQIVLLKADSETMQ